MYDCSGTETVWIVHSTQKKGAIKFLFSHNYRTFEKQTWKNERCGCTMAKQCVCRKATVIDELIGRSLPTWVSSVDDCLFALTASEERTERLMREAAAQCNSVASGAAGESSSLTGRQCRWPSPASVDESLRISAWIRACSPTTPANHVQSFCD